MRPEVNRSRPSSELAQIVATWSPQSAESTPAANAPFSTLPPQVRGVWTQKALRARSTETAPSARGRPDMPSADTAFSLEIFTSSG